MCDPMTAILAMQVGGNVMTGMANAEAAEFQAGVSKNNALISRYMAEDAISRGKIEEGRHRQNVEQMKGEQRAIMSARGLDISSGSAAETIADTAAMGELDALMIRSNAEREAWGHKINESSANTQAAMSKRKARMSPFQTILGAGGQVGQSWYQMGGYTPAGSGSTG